MEDFLHTKKIKFPAYKSLILPWGGGGRVNDTRGLSDQNILNHRVRKIQGDQHGRPFYQSFYALTSGTIRPIHTQPRFNVSTKLREVGGASMFGR